MILITHDLGLVAENANRIAVMYGGRIVEESACAAEFSAARAIPTPRACWQACRGSTSGAPTLYSIPGQVPDLRDPPGGCVFHPRCGLGRERQLCAETRPSFGRSRPGIVAACHYAEETPDWAEREVPQITVDGHADQPAPGRKRRRCCRSRTCTRIFKFRRARGLGSDRLRAVERHFV